MDQLRKDLSKKEASEQANVFRARAAEKELVELRKQLASSKAEADQEKAVLSQEIALLREDLDK